MSAKLNLLRLFSILAVLAMLLANFQPLHVRAQSGDGLERQYNAESGRVSFISPADGRFLSATRALGQPAHPQDAALALAVRYAPEFGLQDAERSLAVMKSDRSEDGRVSVRFQQNYENIPVMGGELIVNTNDRGDLYSISGEVSPHLSISTRPAIDPEQARETALQAVAKWYETTADVFFTTDPELWIFDESLLQPSTRPVELTWRMEVTSKDGSMPVRELVLVNAQRGSISLHFNQVDTSWAPSKRPDDVPPTPTPLPPQPTEPPVSTSAQEMVSTPMPSQDLPSTTETENLQAAGSTSKTLYVATTGSDTNTCLTPGSPCATINGAIGLASDYDIVMIASGTYTGTGGNVVTINKNITLSGGWDSSFAAQNGATVIDGSGVRNGILVNGVTVYPISVTIDHFIVQNSFAGDDGGGIYVVQNASVLLKRSSIVDNTASGRGGGIYLNDMTAHLVLENSTVSGNTANLSGGGVYGISGGVTLKNSTVAYNHSLTTGGGTAFQQGGAILYNSIVAKNTAATSGFDCFGVLYSNGNNLIGDTSGCQVTANTGDKFNVDPLLNSNLAGTPPLHALQPGSPAIDAGNNNTCVSPDQRGVPRPQGSTCDIGPYEYTPGGVNVVNGSGQSVPVSTSFPQPLTVFVYDSSYKPVAGVTVTFSAPSSGASGVFADSGTRTTTAVTNANGNAVSAAITANSQYGSFIVNATASGIPGTAVFNLTNSGILYVATTGSDSNSCLNAVLPCATINGAIGKAISGDTINIAAGTYTGTGNEVILINKNITLSGGWNANFSFQNGWSTIDGQNVRRGVYVNSSLNATIKRLIIQNGALGLYGGGGIYNNSASTLTVNDSVVKNSKGISNYGTMTLNASTVSGSTNSGIFNSGGILTLNNSTLSRNVGMGAGGGGLLNEGTASINNSTISDNSTTFGPGGGIYNLGGWSVNIKNTIIAGNTAKTGGQDCAGTINSAGYNLIGINSGCAFSASASDLTNVDARLSALIGLPGYYPLQADSPAINAGNSCLSTDERGVARPVGPRCDIGAYEYTLPGAAARLLIIDGDGLHVPPGGPLSTPLKAAAVDSQGSPVPGVSVTFTAPDSGASGTFAATGTRTTTVTTDASGVATASIFTANTELGTYTVTASASGAGSINFSLQNITWFVSTTGSDSNDCQSPAAPCARINAVLGKAGFLANDSIRVAAGTFTSSDWVVVLLDKSAHLSGGWNAAFTTQTGWSIVDGQGLRMGVSVNNGVSAVIERFVIQNGSAGAGGGGIDSDGILVVDDSIIRNNTSDYGAGIHNGGTLTVNNSTIMDNQAVIYRGGGDGGGLYNDAIATLNNTTVSGNTARNGGGLFSNKTIKLNNSTISANQATASGGGVYFYGPGYGGTVTLQNTVVAGNQADISGMDCSGPLASAGYNLIGNNKDCTFSATTGDLVGTNSSPVDPLIAPLQAYGGLTPTHALMTGSPAIDAGNPTAPGSGGSACLQADQRGIVRPVGAGCDMGAFEYNGTGTVPTYLTTYSGTPQNVIVATTANLLQVLVVDETGNPLPGITVTFSAPASGASGVFLSTNSATATADTAANGIATAPFFKANSTAGAYVVTAAASGIAAPANFLITNVPASVRTYTANDWSSLPGTLVCTEANPGCSNGFNPHADKAQLYAIGVSAFYLNKHNRAGIDENNMPIISTVNYCGKDSSGNTVCPYYNASWTGEQIVYGDPYGYPLADDVVAHELTHGVTQYESNLFYYYQSGAINESFSDLWGEYYDQTNGKGNDAAYVKWLIGEDVSGYPKPSGFSVPAMRSMSNPPALKDPDKMSSPYYYEGANDNGGVHWNSGINNKAVYLMVNGGTFNGKTVTALGWNKTAAIYYEANSNLLTSGADYSDLYYALQQSCAGLIGLKGITAANCTEVKDAINAVEMNSQPAANFNTDAPLCPSSSAVTKVILADDLETGTGSWAFDNGAQLRWQHDSPYGPFAQSGQHFLYGDDYPQDDDTPTDARATLVSFTVPGYAYLWFAHAYDFETGYEPYDPTLHNYDGGVLEYTEDGGASWVDAAPLVQYNGYKGSIYSAYNNPLSGRSAFVGTSHGYVSTRLNLASLAGKTVSFRWRMGLDGYISAWGWWVDNVRVYTCAPASFTDVPSTHPYYQDIEILYANKLTGGCQVSPPKFCPDQTMNRGQAAAFLLRANFGPTYVPDPATHIFMDDWTKGPWAEPWAEAMKKNEYSAGCQASPPKYCPWDLIPREQAVIFILKLKYGKLYTPPPATGTVFADMTNPSFYATAWAEQAYKEGLIPDCGMSGGKPKFCPKTLVSRGLAAYMIVRAKNLTMP